MKSTRVSQSLDWQERAACKGMDQSIFFPEGTYTQRRGRMPRDEQPAKRVCQSCPVQAKCLSYGLRDRYGVWGGMGEEERAELRRRQGVQATA